MANITIDTYVKGLHKLAAAKWVTSLMESAQKNPATTAFLGGAAAGGIYGGAKPVAARLKQQNKENDSQMLTAIMNPFKATKRQNINTGVGFGVGAAVGTGIYKALNALPVARKYKILRAMIAAIGGTAAGTLAWQASDNVQANS